eukprot:9118212-Pyramimonas_sp.AAC.1
MLGGDYSRGHGRPSRVTPRASWQRLGGRIRDSWGLFGPAERAPWPHGRFQISSWGTLWVQRILWGSK